jgi:DUF177 domain-containing protein
MLTEPLTNTLDVRKAAARGVAVSGALQPQQLPRFRALLAEDEGSIAAELAFSKDEENRPVIQVQVRAEVQVICQRCLQSMQTELETENNLAVVWTDDQASHLPRHLEPLIVADGEDGYSLWEIVEDELILALPPYSYHESEDCNELLSDLAAQPSGEGESEGKSNPFDVLAQLKPGEKTRS